MWMGSKLKNTKKKRISWKSVQALKTRLNDPKRLLNFVSRKNEQLQICRRLVSLRPFS